MITLVIFIHQNIARMKFIVYTKWRMSNILSKLSYSEVIIIFIKFLKKICVAGDLRVIRSARMELICASKENSDIFA